VTHHIVAWLFVLAVGLAVAVVVLVAVLDARRKR